MASLLTKRQFGYYDPDNDDDDDYYSSWWYSDAGIAVKYALWSAFIVALLAYFVGGRIHAQRRIRKGLPPLAYHRWLVSRRQRARFDPQPAPPLATYRYMAGSGPAYGQTYGMADYSAPPPAYHSDIPPSYQPPPGASKVDPHQVHVMEVNNGGAASSSAGGLAAPGPIYNPGTPAVPRSMV